MLTFRTKVYSWFSLTSQNGRGMGTSVTSAMLVRKNKMLGTAQCLECEQYGKQLKEKGKVKSIQANRNQWKRNCTLMDLLAGLEKDIWRNLS